MGLVDGRKVYISRIDAATNTIELALWEELFKTEVWARNFNWLIDEPRERRGSPPCCTMAAGSSAAGSLCTDKDFLTKKK